MGSKKGDPWIELAFKIASKILWLHFDQVSAPWTESICRNEDVFKKVLTPFISW
jgi:hypothetical protein